MIDQRICGCCLPGRLGRLVGGSRSRIHRRRRRGGRYGCIGGYMSGR